MYGRNQALDHFLYGRIVRRKRPFSTEAQIIGLSYTVEKGFFRLNFFGLKIPIGGSSRKTRVFRLDPPVEKTQSKKFYTCFFNRSHRSSHHQTHTHTTTRPHTHTRNYTAVSYKALTLAWLLLLLLLLAANQRGAFLVPLASSVCHTTAAARGIDPMLPITAAPAVTLAALG